MRKTLKNCIIFLFSLIVSIFFFELIFRFSEISLPSIVNNDSKLGRDFNPNRNVMLLNEGFYLGKINEGGYLGEYFPKSKSESSFRIALCGDSFVEGFQLFTKYHFGTILRDSLQKKVTKNIEVLNFGKSGQDLRTIYINYQEKVKQYNPDLVLFFLNNSDFTTRDNNLGPTLVLENDSICIDYSFNKSSEFIFKNKLSFLRDYSSFSLFQSANLLIKNGKTVDILLDKLSPSYLFKQSNNPSTRSIGQQSDKYYDLNEAVLSKIQKINKLSHEQIIIIQMENFIEKYDSLVNDYQIEQIKLLKPLQKLRDEGIDPYYWRATNKEGHWNVKAHQEIGNYLSIILKEFVN